MDVKRLWKLYNLKPEDDEKLRAHQDNCCPICERPLGDRGVTDHQHHGDDAGLIRGKLCWTCNKGLGFLLGPAEKIERLEAAITYLKNPPAVAAIGKRYGRIGRTSNQGTQVAGSGKRTYRCGCTGKTKACPVHRQPDVSPLFQGVSE